MHHQRVYMLAAALRLIVALAAAWGSEDVASTRNAHRYRPGRLLLQSQATAFFPLSPGMVFMRKHTSDAGTVFVTGEVLRDTTVVMGVECVTCVRDGCPLTASKAKRAASGMPRTARAVFGTSTKPRRRTKAAR